MRNLPGRAPEDDIQEPPFAVAANNQEIGEDTAGRLDNDRARVADRF